MFARTFVPRSLNIPQTAALAPLVRFNSTFLRLCLPEATEPGYGGHPVTTEPPAPGERPPPVKEAVRVWLCKLRANPRSVVVDVLCFPGFSARRRRTVDPVVAGSSPVVLAET
jgi:hypothetical protein